VRYYAQGLGRFISADTIIASLANPQSLNRYSYVYNNPINNSDPTGHKACDEQWGCEGRPPQPSTPPNGSTNTNTPGGSNRPAGRAKSAKDTGGNDTPTGWSPDVGPLPSVFVGDPADVRAAWDLLEEAAAYGPRTRSHIEGMLKATKIVQGYGGQGMKITLVRNKIYPIGDFGTNSIDIGDIQALPRGFNNPLAPANAMLHEFTEQWMKQIGGKTEFWDAHGPAIDAENMANSERYAHGTAPVRPRQDDIPTYIGDSLVRESMTIRYDVTFPESGGQLQALVTITFGAFAPEIEWR
jgi:hypothetical protein